MCRAWNRFTQRQIYSEMCHLPPTYRVCLSASVSNLLYELDHANTLSLVEGYRASQTVELSREPQWRQTFSVSVKSSSSGIAECLPWTLRWVQRVQSNAAEDGSWKFINWHMKQSDWLFSMVWISKCTFSIKFSIETFSFSQTSYTIAFWFVKINRLLVVCLDNFQLHFQILL